VYTQFQGFDTIAVIVERLGDRAFALRHEVVVRNIKKSQGPNEHVGGTEVYDASFLSLVDPEDPT
jgi:hypothetical protein